MLESNHPIWPIIRISLLLAAMVLILWMNASKFDVTELKAIVQLFLGAIGIEAGVKAIKAIGKKESE